MDGFNQRLPRKDGCTHPFTVHQCRTRRVSDFLSNRSSAASMSHCARRARWRRDFSRDARPTGLRSMLTPPCSPLTKTRRNPSGRRRERRRTACGVGMLCPPPELFAAVATLLSVPPFAVETGLSRGGMACSVRRARRIKVRHWRRVSQNVCAAPLFSDISIRRSSTASNAKCKLMSGRNRRESSAPAPPRIHPRPSRAHPVAA